jgi:vibriolysin
LYRVGFHLRKLCNSGWHPGRKTADSMRRLHHPVLGSLLAAAALSACGPTPPDAHGDGDAKDDGIPSDVAYALGQLPDAHVLSYTADGLPTFIVGEMAKVGAMQSDDAATAQAALAPSLPPILAPFRLRTSDLVLRKMNVDEDGGRHFRYSQTFNGLDVVGGDLVIHVDVKGAIHAVNGSARGDISPKLGVAAMSDSTARAKIAADARFSDLTTASTRMVYIQTNDGALHKAYEAIVQGSRAGIRGGMDPVRDKVYVDVDSGAIVADYPQIHFAESRKVYTASNGTSLPGTVKRTEGQAAGTDVDVNGAYDGTGDAYEAYKGFWNRDSYDNAGATLISSVHYDQNYCNAYWDSTQMVYGDGDPSQGCQPLARAVDVTAHELTHAVTERESGLNYSGESGGMNESMSDIFGAFVEAWVDGGKTGTLAVSAHTWLVGELVIAPALRWMCDPAMDGASADVWSSTVGNLDVHYSSGVGNLAFCMLSQGGTHPRGKTTTPVTGIGMDKAIRILYKAQVDILTSTANYAAVRTAMEQASTALGYDQATTDSVSCAWAAVKVGTAPASCGGTGGGGGGGGGTDGTLTSGTPVTGISDAVGGQKFWKITVPASQSTLTVTIAGGTGDADLYLQGGSKPTLTTYTCRPYITGNSETCTITSPAAGDYWVMLNAYAAYSGVTLTGTYTGGGGGGGGDPLLTNGVPVTGISGATSSTQFWRITAPAGKTLTVKITGSTGDADLYTRKGARPTTTTYDCRPYLSGDNETCTTTNTAASDYYVMVRGYAAFSGVSLVASY